MKTIRPTPAASSAQITPFAVHAYIDDPLALHHAWQEANKDKKMRARDAAEFLGVSECELIAAGVGLSTTRLAGEWVAMLKRIKGLGRVMALTRNHAVVHERHGVYLDASSMGKMGLVLGDDIDLRLFFSHWKYGYARVEKNADTVQRSIQFFDESGDAVHKIFLGTVSDVDEFELFVAEFSADNQQAGERVTVKVLALPAVMNADVDVNAFRMAWAKLQDTHDFFALLKNFNVSRTQALRLAEPRFAEQVAPATARQMLEAAARRRVEIMCFVGNAACIQIHTGHVSNIKVMAPWLNVLDADFNLHLREDLIHEAWIVKKPTVDGIVTALEFFDRNGTQITQFFGKRKPGQPERNDWREIVAGLSVHAHATQMTVAA